MSGGEDNASLLKAVNINHLTLCVSDIERMASFLHGLFDPPIFARSDFEVDLSIGGSFLAVMKNDRPLGIDHFCIGIEDFDADRVAKIVEARGYNPFIITDTKGITFREPQVYVTGPDDIVIQFSRADYRGEMPPVR